jgi:hypothetical protein
VEGGSQWCGWECEGDQSEQMATHTRSCRVVGNLHHVVLVECRESMATVECVWIATGGGLRCEGWIASETSGYWNASVAVWPCVQVAHAHASSPCD